MTESVPVTYRPRRTVSYNPYADSDLRLRALTHEVYPTGFYVGLMRRDAREVLPHEYGSSGGFTPALSSDDQVRAMALLTGALAEWPRELSLHRALEHFYTSTADQLLSHGRAYYEIVFADAESATPGDPPIAFRLAAVPAGTVRTRYGRLVQYVPAKDATRRARRGPGFIDLGGCAVACIELDRETERRLRVGTEALAHPDLGIAPADPAARLAAAKRATIQAAGIGWSGSTEPLSPQQLWPYQVWRRLEFLAFTIGLRDTITAGLNNALALAGLELHLPMTFALRDVPTLEHVRKAQQDLAIGRRTLSHLYEVALGLK